LIGLLDEMMSPEEVARYPAIPYRTYTLSGRAQRVIFEQKGPGVITRIRLASDDKRGVVRFYFDGSPSAEITLNSYDLSLINIPSDPGVKNTLLTAGGSVLYFPIPFDRRCKITFEEAPNAEPTPKYYQISYRRYPENISMETFSLQKLSHMKRRITLLNRRMLNPDLIRKSESVVKGEGMVEAGSPLAVKLPAGGYGVYEMQLTVMPPGDSNYAQCMRDVVVQGIFDGKQTVRVPVSDLSGGGMGAPYVESRYLSADGWGKVTVNWLMPYREKASLAFINEGSQKIHVKYTIYVAPLTWDERMLYFHASWKEETNLPPGQWNMSTISGGRGVYKGDVLTLYNHSTEWYGNGRATVSVDDDILPSHMEDTAGDYYNNPRLPVAPFHTPFGGAPRADWKSSHGYNTFFRTRILDHIPFESRLSFDMEMTSTVDCATTIFWYGDRKARPQQTTRPDEWARTLPPPPSNDTIH
jgi:hypothetical protein